jgi:hypothetical protein
MNRISCPICYGPSAQVLEDYVLNVGAQHDLSGSEHRQVGGLQVFRCSNAHIFFIRVCDLGLERKRLKAAA